MRDDFKKQLKLGIQESNAKTERDLRRESDNLRDFVILKKAETEEGYVNGLKDLDVKLTNQWTNKFSDYKIMFDDAMRDFNTLKNDLNGIKQEYLNSMNTLENKLTNKLRRDLETQRGIFIGRLNQQREDMVEYVENMMKNMKNEVELNKSAVNAAISSAKEDILGD